MQVQPVRLRRFGGPLLRRSSGAGDADGWPLTGAEQRRLLRRARAVRRCALILIWSLIAIPMQAVLILLPGRSKIDFARFYWATVGRILGVRVRSIGASAARVGKDGARPVVFVANHSSWLDIVVLGGRLPAVFVSKDEVARWPGISVVARLGRTLFVTRKRGRTGEELAAMRDRLGRGDNILLFPEGTSSDGSRVLPFRSSFFAVVEPAGEGDEVRPLVQPVSVAYDRLGWLPAGRANRLMFAWFGDMRLGPHLWRLAQQRGVRATVLLHTPVEPARFANRKALSQAAWTAVADGAATLRQNRPARPLVVGGRTEAAEPAREERPAYG